MNKNNDYRDKKKKPFQKIKKFFDGLKNFIINNPDYMILLVMLILTSLLYEPYGVTRTLPLILIGSFFLGTFCGRKRRIMVHTIIALLIEASISQDYVYSSQVIVITLILAFSGAYVAKYLEKFKTDNMIKKILGGFISVLLIVVSLVAYSLRYGTITDYYAARNSVNNYIIQNEITDLYSVGLQYNYETHMFEYEFANVEDTSIRVRYCYSKNRNLVFEKDSLVSENDNTENEIIEEENK